MALKVWYERRRLWLLEILFCNLRTARCIFCRAFNMIAGFGRILSTSRLTEDKKHSDQNPSPNVSNPLKHPLAFRSWSQGFVVSKCSGVKAGAFRNERIQTIQRRLQHFSLEHKLHIDTSTCICGPKLEALRGLVYDVPS